MCVRVNELTCLVHLLSPAGLAEMELDAVNIWRWLHWVFASPLSSLSPPVSISALLPHSCLTLPPVLSLHHLLFLISPSDLFLISSLHFCIFFCLLFNLYYLSLHLFFNFFLCFLTKIPFRKWAFGTPRSFCWGEHCPLCVQRDRFFTNLHCPTRGKLLKWLQESHLLFLITTC